MMIVFLLCAAIAMLVGATANAQQSADRQLKDFPGRSFQILSVSSMNKKALKEKVSVLKNANITTRNFPINANQLRKKLKLAEGGDTYIFATTTQQKEHLLFICRKI